MTQDNVPEGRENQYAVLLPCGPEEFGEFISGLFGKPQTVERHIPGAFVLTKADVANLYHLVDQRIHQQNEATLVQFTVRIVYNDNSSVQLRSLEDFMVYGEMRPVASTGAHLSWTYLVQFRNKSILEKQQIDLSFIGSSISPRVEAPIVTFDDDFDVRGEFIRRISPHNIILSIQHTERTWAVDIDSLLAGAVNNFVVPRKPSAKFIHKNSGRIGVGVSLTLLTAAALTIVFKSESFLDSYLAEAKALKAAAPTSQDALTARIDFLIEIISTGVWPRFVFAAVAFLIIMIAVSIILGAWVSDKASIPPRSFVLFSKAAEDETRALDQRIKRDWALFGLSLATSVVTGVLSSWLFVKFFGDAP